jgi:hypothetical protein
VPVTPALNRPGLCRFDRGELLARRPVRWIVLAGVVILLAACSTTDSDAPAQPGGDGTANPVATEIELAAELVTSRRDQAGGQIRVRLTNHSAGAVPIDAIRLVAPPYSPEPARVNTRELAPGRTVVYPVVHGEPECAGAAPTAGPVSVEIDSAGRQLSVVPADSELIERMLATACGRQRIAELVDIGLDSDWEWSEGSNEQTGTLTIARRTAGPPLTLTGVRGGVNFTLELLELSGPLILAADEDTLTLPVRSRAARCEAHALADNSKPYGFSAWLAIGDDPPIHIEFSAHDQPDNFDRLCGSG